MLQPLDASAESCFASELSASVLLGIVIKALALKIAPLSLQEFLLDQRAEQMNRAHGLFQFLIIFMAILEVLEFIRVTLDTICYLNRKICTINNYVYLIKSYYIVLLNSLFIL